MYVFMYVCMYVCMYDWTTVQAFRSHQYHNIYRHLKNDFFRNLLKNIVTLLANCKMLSTTTQGVENIIYLHLFLFLIWQITSARFYRTTRVT